MKSPLLILLSLLLTLPARAQQTVVTGRIIDRSTGQPLPGCTVLQLGTTNGVSSNADGTFSLAVPDAPDSVTITVSSIGYITQQRSITRGGSADFGLSLNNKDFCDLSITPIGQAGLTSGTRYAPLGAQVQLYGRRVLNQPFSLSAAYQTNLARNHALALAIGLPALRHGPRLTITESLHYQQLQAAPANLRFRAYSALLGLGIYRIGPLRVPELLLGGGYARQQQLTTGETTATASYGYTVGLRRYFGHPLWAQVQAQATRWLGTWQLQASATRPVFGKISAGISYQQLRRYQEVSLTLSRQFY